jgi:hypothetical protein
MINGARITDGLFECSVSFTIHLMVWTSVFFHCTSVQENAADKREQSLGQEWFMF